MFFLKDIFKDNCSQLLTRASHAATPESWLYTLEILGIVSQFACAAHTPKVAKSVNTASCLCVCVGGVAKRMQIKRQHCNCMEPKYMQIIHHC